ncbi:uncharacterized protein METZ01_LOCUS277601, partial [marine metagenome]
MAETQPKPTEKSQPGLDYIIDSTEKLIWHAIQKNSHFCQQTTVDSFMSGILAHPIGQSLALPFAVSMFCSFLIRFFLNGERGQRWAVLAVSAGVLVSYLAMLGIPTFPPRFSSQKFFYIVVLVTLA